MTTYPAKCIRTQHIPMARRYSDGYRYCSRCMEYRKTVYDRCPECGTMMRSKPRRRKHEDTVWMEIEPVRSVAE
ncbi:MAG: hypothetical protein QW318_03495 [Candidatus Caldarchaeum sp.]|uniref:Uncharacterized protein n=1 Tax=Caldiarchaeum subterraneum TaxID=311458 RepID=A0A7J3G4I3_CALS0